MIQWLIDAAVIGTAGFVFYWFCVHPIVEQLECINYKLKDMDQNKADLRSEFADIKRELREIKASLDAIGRN